MDLADYQFQLSLHCSISQPSVQPIRNKIIDMLSLLFLPPETFTVGKFEEVGL